MASSTASITATLGDVLKDSGLAPDSVLEQISYRHLTSARLKERGNTALTQTVNKIYAKKGMEDIRRALEGTATDEASQRDAIREALIDLADGWRRKHCPRS